MNQRVLDISAYQGEVDFQRVKQDGIWGVMLKATEGERYLSPAFEKNYRQAKQANLEVGAYHYLRASTGSGGRGKLLFKQALRKAADPAAGGGYRGAGATAD